MGVSSTCRFTLNSPMLITRPASSTGTRSSRWISAVTAPAAAAPAVPASRASQQGEPARPAVHQRERAHRATADETALHGEVEVRPQPEDGVDAEEHRHQRQAGHEHVQQDLGHHWTVAEVSRSGGSVIPSFVMVAFWTVNSTPDGCPNPTSAAGVPVSTFAAESAARRPSVG